MIPHGAIEEWFGAIYQGVDYSWRFEVSTFGRLRNTKTKHVYSFGYGGRLSTSMCFCQWYAS